MNYTCGFSILIIADLPLEFNRILVVFLSIRENRYSNIYWNFYFYAIF